MDNTFLRSAWLIGEDAINILKTKKVAVFGIGGVGSYVCESLVRSGIGRFLLVDGDTICITNLNRQLIATRDTIGQNKTDVMKKRMLSISPTTDIDTKSIFFLGENGEELLSDCDYIVDCVDTVAAKLALCKLSHRLNIPIISSMGTGNKLDPSLLQVSDIFDTKVCPLCRIMRSELKKQGIEKLKVVYSEELPITPKGEDVNCDKCKLCNFQKNNVSQKRSPGSLSFVPASAGILLACCVVRDFLNII